MTLLGLGILSGTLMGLGAEASRPQMGDLIVFGGLAREQTSPIAGKDGVTLRASKLASGEACKLSPEVMAREGGSLWVFGLDGTGAKVHWAGGETSSGQDSCGRSADLAMHTSDVAYLVAVGRRANPPQSHRRGSGG